MDKKKFHVLLRDFNGKKLDKYDVLPYFRNEWKETPYERDDNGKKVKIETKEDLKKWISKWSQYRYWARCEYEFLIGSWPFGSRKMTEKVIEFFSKNPNIKEIKDNIDFYNIITSEMECIDVHEQIMMNIDIITDILYEEFLEKKTKK